MAANMYLICLILVISVRSYAYHLCYETESGLKITEHIKKDGTQRCCERIQCPPGGYGEICVSNDEPHNTTCLPCPANHYSSVTTYSDDDYACHPFQICDSDAGFYVAKEGTPTSDVECECDLEKGYHLYVDGMCFQDMCPSGEQLTVTGDCEPCRLGMFKEEFDFGSCVPWTDCSRNGLMLVEHGNSTHDTLCAEKYDPKMEQVVSEYNNRHNWKILVAVIIPSVLVLMVIAFTVFLLVRCHKGPPFGLRFGESSDGLDDSRASEESFPSEKVVLPIVTTGGFHGKHTELKIDVTKTLPHDQMDRSSPDSAYDSINNFQGKSSTEEICGYIMEPPSEQKCLLSKQDSTDITENPSGNPSIIIINSMHLMQGENTTMNINNNKESSIIRPEMAEDIADAAQQTYRSTLRRDSTTSDIAWQDVEDTPPTPPYDDIFTTKYDAGEAMEAWPDSPGPDNNYMPPDYNNYHRQHTRHTEV